MRFSQRWREVERDRDMEAVREKKRARNKELVGYDRHTHTLCLAWQIKTVATVITSLISDESNFPFR